MTLQNVGISAKIKKLSNTAKLIKVRNGLVMTLQKVSSHQNKPRNPTRS